MKYVQRGIGAPPTKRTTKMSAAQTSSSTAIQLALRRKLIGIEFYRTALRDTVMSSDKTQKGAKNLSAFHCVPAILRYYVAP